MKYRLLDNQSGVVVGRNPVLLKEKLFLSFQNAQGKLTALIQSQGESFYRELKNCVCEVNADKLQGVVKVTLFDASSTLLQRRWVCEELYVDHTEGGVWVYPNDANLPQIVADLRLENENLRLETEALRSSIDELNERFERLVEGYDIT